jgi:hypothetical protein
LIISLPLPRACRLPVVATEQHTPKESIPSEVRYGRVAQADQPGLALGMNLFAAATLIGH